MLRTPNNRSRISAGCSALIFCLLCRGALLPGLADAKPADAAKGAVSYICRPIAAVKTTTPPKIDGDLSDPCWQTAPKAVTFLDVQNGTVVADQTTAYLLYDDKYIYVAFDCQDSQPQRITARETVQDTKYQGNGNDTEDYVEVGFDPFKAHRYEDRTLFSLNAIGTRSARLSGGRANKVEWKGDWTGAVKRTPHGWTAEMQIPWSSLNYPAGKSKATMCVNFTRFQEHAKILSVWSNFGPQGFFDRDGLWTDVEVPRGLFHPHLSLLPYTLPIFQSGASNSRFGLDARYALTPQLTAVGSINPEFATVEGAVQSIAFQRGERYVPESRPFFLEGGDFFNVSNINIIGNYFFSNRIGTFDVGSKLYGKVTPKDTLGFLQTLDFGNRSDIVTRLRHDLSSTSQVGFFLAQKSAKDDNNTVGLVSQNARWGKLTLDSQWALTGGHEAGGDAKQSALLYADKLVLWALGVVDVSPNFRDADGFVPFNDYRGVLLLSQWGAQWRKGFWRSFNFNTVPTYQWHTDGRPFQRGGNLDLSFDARQDWQIGLHLNYNRFEEQTDATFGLSFTSGVSNRFRQWGFYVQTGKQGDRPSTFIGPQFSVRMFRHLDLAYGGAIQSLNGLTQQHIATLNYELSPTRAFGGRVVVQDKDTNWYLFYRNSGGRGTNMFVVLGDPNATRFVKRLAIKLVFAL